MKLADRDAGRRRIAPRDQPDPPRAPPPPDLGRRPLHRRSRACLSIPRRMTETKLLVGELPRFDTIGGAVLFLTGGYADLLFALEPEDGVFHAGFRFTSMRALRFRQETHCTGWHVEGAYGRLVEVQPSECVAELTTRMVENARSASDWDMHHYLIYVPDEGGAYEIAAESWRALQVKPGPLPGIAGPNRLT